VSRQLPYDDETLKQVSASAAAMKETLDALRVAATTLA
jgi:hypothetical protein